MARTSRDVGVVMVMGGGASEEPIRGGGREGSPVETIRGRE